MVQKYSNLLTYFVIFFVGAFLVSPLLTPGFFPMHDDTQVARVFEMGKALKDGAFPVRWVSDLGYGYGYPIFNFYAPLAYYVGAFFLLIGFNALVATKIMIAIPIFTLGVGMYLLGKMFWGKSGGLISSILAMSAPYIALLIFVRGAISEYYALSFIPLVFLGMAGLFITGKYRYVFLISISLAGVVLSHNLTALIISPFVLILTILLIFAKQKEERKRLLFAFVVAGVIGILLSAFYWTPALAEMRYTNVSSQVGGGADFHDHFVCPIQLWESGWGFGGSTEGCLDGLSFRIGKIHLLLGLLVVPLLFFIKKRETRASILFGFFIFCTSVFMTLSESSFIWDSFGFLSYIQYPWRFLGIISLSLSFMIGALVLYINIFMYKKQNVFYMRTLLTLVILILSLLTYLKLFQPQFIGPKSPDDYVNLEKLKFDTSKISDEYMPEGFTKPKSKEEVPSGIFSNDQSILLVSQDLKSHMKDFVVDVDKDNTPLHLNIAYFPGWTIFVDGSRASLEEENKKIKVILTTGRHEIKVVYENTAIQKLANLASVIGVCILVVGIIKTYRKKSL